MITRADVADLQPGDVVCVTNDKFPDVTMQGPLRPDAETSGRRLMLGATVIRCDDRSPMYPTWNLTVVSRAPRPLYVNHPRTSPVPGDVACDAVTDDPAFVWCYLGKPGLASWCDRWGYTLNQSDLSDRLRLLVDGVTGLVVP